ncbi:MAG: 4-alpha-glucanotransferase [Chlamydia sp.]
MVCITSDRFLFQQQWAKVGVSHHHGVALPLSAIYTQKSSGVGEILDLLPMMPWLQKCGFSLLQLLPINDSGDDPSPYMALSASAIHPIYLSISDLDGIASLPAFSLFQDESYRLNSLPRLQYHTVLERKLTLLRTYIESSIGQKICNSDEYFLFCQQEASWLLPYSLFKALKIKNHGVAWWHFEEHKSRPESAEELLKKDLDLSQETNFWSFIQYLLFNQWKRVRAVADQYQIQLMGDLPILVNRDSSDVWWRRELFLLDMSVGAPPDIYSEEGQIWGFPLYKWNKMREEGYQWFSNRLHIQERLYDLYRIDHVVGLYRFWAVAPGKRAIEGLFIPAIEKEWIAQGEELIDILAKTTNMLPIGEDLGDIPDSVRLSLRQLGIPSYKVLRWERDWKNGEKKNALFLDPKQFSPESMVTVSTHDSSTLKGWWEEDILNAQQFCADMKIEWNSELTIEIRHAILSITHKAASLFHVNLLQEYLAFIPAFSWENAQFDRINSPGTVSSNNWTWKNKISIEEFSQDQNLIQIMRSLFI